MKEGQRVWGLSSHWEKCDWGLWAFTCDREPWSCRRVRAARGCWSHLGWRRQVTNGRGDKWVWPEEQDVGRSQGGDSRGEKTVGVSRSEPGAVRVPAPGCSRALIARPHAGWPRQIARVVPPATSASNLSRTDPLVSSEHRAIPPPSLCYEHVTPKAPFCQTPGTPEPFCFPQPPVRHCPSNLLRRQ